ncbi:MULTISPECIES: Asp-tRNA(Asn)/Glu-tRNA(Gln) amidotransferase subunit GatA [unclassified Thioalkalivibrio]|uniref:Asp-tRNA(Asn)/Glu-tRNA(Gln) amidotransferase subunit GatA n=1 Tax=unclassified Thioalkalivibrio TaxID=2621013 RepID=UPI000368ACE6|nr:MULTISPECIES: Asp-tRNA(Asn)/Glu-tRNA(Gln) amidotransferase subunit GatA [unclassified Thioalkalivibrio]
MAQETLSGWVRKLQAREISSRELTQLYLDRIERLDPQLNSFITVTAEQALAQADAADARLAQGEQAPLLGVPIAQKDIFCTEGVRTSCGSRMLDPFVSPYNATVVERMNAAGAVMLGKTNMDEFAMGSSNETSFYGPVRNPWDTERVPGGSSGGSAAAVGARLVPGATGTDTGGSIRQPAAFCGITGLKPTYGRVSRYGMIAFASSLDQGGPMAATAEDCGRMLNAMAGFDERDSTSVERPAEDFTAGLNQDLKGLRIGLPTEFFGEAGLDERVRGVIDAAIEVLKGRGAEVREVGLPNSHLSVPAYYVVAPAECSSNLARFDGVRYGYRCENPEDLMDLYTRSRGEGFGDEVKRRIMVGTYVLSAGYYDAYYLKAQKVRRIIADDFRRAFADVDVLLAPTTPELPFALGAKADPVSMYLSDIYTIAANLAGLPAMSLPAGEIDGLPVGLQLIGNYFDEARLLGVAHQYQQETDWHTRVPAAFA